MGERHYDLGNEFYRDMLDPRMTCTCGFWGDGAATLAEAQEHKLDLICRKLDLQPGQRILDIGCGWGSSFMIYAAEHYGVECVGLTVCREQAALGEKLAGDLPVEFRLMDYRDDEPLDHIVSVGMFEHVGRDNYDEYVEVARRCLKPEGLSLLHTIGTRHAGLPPAGISLPATQQVVDACEGHFVVEDFHNFGADTTIARGWRGTRTSRPPSPVGASTAARVSVACGSTTCNHAPARCVPTISICGNSSSRQQAHAEGHLEKPS